IPGWEHIPIKEMLEEAFNVPVAIQNDVNAAALGENTFGVGQKYNDFLFLTYGTGVGGAIVIDSALYSGHEEFAGEFGHMIHMLLVERVIAVCKGVMNVMLQRLLSYKMHKK